MRRTTKQKPWTTAEIKQLGRMSDCVLARKTGRTIRQVQSEREALLSKSVSYRV